MICYEILKKHETLGYWALAQVHYAKDTAEKALAKILKKEPNAEVRLVENANPWYE